MVINLVLCQLNTSNNSDIFFDFRFNEFYDLLASLCQLAFDPNILWHKVKQIHHIFRLFGHCERIRIAIEHLESENIIWLLLLWVEWPELLRIWFYVDLVIRLIPNFLIYMFALINWLSSHFRCITFDLTFIISHSSNIFQIILGDVSLIIYFDHLFH